MSALKHEITFESERRRRGAVLRVMCLSLMMVVASVASLNVGLPDLARDTIVYSGHFDHDGVFDGKIFPGADDNGSGSAGTRCHCAR